jgi:phosphotransferase system HPr-like phosphotransfer protein
MLTASITLSPERNIVPISLSSIERMGRNFHSKILIRRGNSESLDIHSIPHLQQFVREHSPQIEINVSGKDEMKALSSVVDFFNHGSGI